MSRWVEFAGDRPPVVFHVLFWGAALVITVSYGNVFQQGVRLTFPGWPLAQVLFVVSLAALPVACVLWHLLPWRPSPSPARRAVAVAFLAASLLLMFAGELTLVLLSCLAAGNALLVFGLRAALAYAAVTGLFYFAVSALNPHNSLPTAVLNGLIALFVCLVIVLVLVSLLEARRQAVRTRQVLAELEEAHAELRRYAEQSRDLAVAEERARMARDMHDSIGHYLTVINMNLANAQRFRQARPEAAWEEVRQAQALTREALNDTRRWVRALKPLSMEGRSGVAALRMLAESFRSPDLEVAFTVSGAWPELAEAHELVCYRVLQEGLTNALRHSRAHRIEVSLTCGDGEVTLTVSDDGRGASPEAVSEGFGLRGLEDRLREVGGTLETDSRPGGGFRLRARVGGEARVGT